MTAAESLDPNASLYAWLAHDLRLYRHKYNLTGTQMGQIIGCVRSHVSNLEAGRVRIDDRQAKVLDEKWGTGGHFQRLLWFARAAHDPDWFLQYSQYEAEALAIKIYQGQVIPGPLQTKDYARALLLAGSASDIDLELEERLARQDAILNKPEPPLLWVLMDEGVLDRPVGGPEIMRAQLHRLLEMGGLPHVIVRVVPRSAGAHLGLDGAFRIISLESRDVAYVGAQGGGRLIEGTAEVRALGVRFDRIGAKASSEDASRALIEQLLEGAK
jgi:hypothetical protein